VRVRARRACQCVRVHGQRVHRVHQHLLSQNSTAYSYYIHKEYGTSIHKEYSTSVHK
jgi:hypothetical protein